MIAKDLLFMTIALLIWLIITNMIVDCRIVRYLGTRQDRCSCSKKASNHISLPPASSTSSSMKENYSSFDSTISSRPLDFMSNYQDHLSDEENIRQKALDLISKKMIQEYQMSIADDRMNIANRTFPFDSSKGILQNPSILPGFDENDIFYIK